jgi:hypothetical protein
MRVAPTFVPRAWLPLLLGDDVVAATYNPGFEADLSNWTLWIDRTGILRQEVRVSIPENNFKGECRTERAQVGVAEVQALLRLAEEAGLQNCCPVLGLDNLEDQETITVVVRLATGVAAISAYGAFLAASQGMPEEVQLLRLWKRIERLSPYKSAYR